MGCVALVFLPVQRHHGHHPPLLMKYFSEGHADDKRTMRTKWGGIN